MTRISRRAAFAALLLTTNPIELSQFGDRPALSITFDSITELRAWLTREGLDTPDLLTGEHTNTTQDGRSYRSLHAYPTWRGWEIYADARDYLDAPALDEQTTTGLADLAALAVEPDRVNRDEIADLATAGTQTEG
jgi:hypothetical protein